MAIDAFISMFLVCMGDFNLEGQNYTQGNYRIIVWFFLMLAAFIEICVFMNMLIAIMGATFNKVEE